MRKKRNVRKIWKATIAGITSLCVLLITILFFVSGGFMKQSYLEPWSKDYAAQFDDPRVRLAANGLLAASNHNMQPWKIKLDSTNAMVFYLYADSSRLTPAVDPYARQFMISQGTFLEYVAVAGKNQGFQTEIQLFPYGDYDETKLKNSIDQLPVAKITLTTSFFAADSLYDSIFLPDTNRNEYLPDKLSVTQKNTLIALCNTEPIAIQIYEDAENRNRIGEFALQSALIEAETNRVMEESSLIFRSNEYQKNQYRYGYSVEGQGISGFTKHIIQGLVTLFPSMNTGKSASQNMIRSTKTSIDNTPAYALIVSDGNTRKEQVKSGMLYSRMVLTAHTLGLTVQPLSQVLEEYPEMQVPYDKFRQAYAPNNGTVQMLIRVGIPTKPIPQSLRQDVMSFTETQ